MFAGVAQLVEHNLAKVGVAGPNPVARSRKKQVKVEVKKHLKGTFVFDSTLTSTLTLTCLYL